MREVLRLEAFRIQNYKKIADTDWINVGDLTVFVGKNEAGKSALFRGLSKLSPSDGQKYDGLKEFPRSRYSDEFKTRNWPAASGRFVLTTEERGEIAKICPRLKDADRAEVTRHYNDETLTTFITMPKFTSASGADLRGAIDRATAQIRELTAPEGKGEALAPVKTNILSGLAQAKSAIPDGAIAKTQVDPAINAISAQANEAWQKELVAPVIEGLTKVGQAADDLVQLAAAKKWVVEHLPKFIYFDKYNVLETAIHIPSFISQLSSNPSAPRARTTNCLFLHVGLDPNELQGLGRHQPGSPEDENIRRQIDQRMILSASASIAMTEKFSDWWEQRKHKFEYKLDADYLRIWVSDDIDPSPIELDQRSEGMQYFFSFYVVFLVESKGAHAGSILLLDEPGLHLHGTAQGKAVELLGRLSRDNQTMYSTHSPFMIDPDHLERARAVFEGDDGTTKVTEDVWPKDSETLFPLQAALGYQIAQALFLSKRQVIVEGITDKWITGALDIALEAKGRTRLRRDVVIVPSAGLSKLLPLASMLVGHDIEVAALLDGDEPGRKEGKKLVEKLLDRDNRRCLFIGDFASGPELEDLFPEADYLSAVEEAYKIKVALNADEKKLPAVVDRVKAFFVRSGAGDFDKWKPAAILRDRIVAEPARVPDSVLNVIEEIYKKLNSLLT